MAKMLSKSAALIFTLFTINQLTALATTHYVANSGSGNLCTLSQPCASIQVAINQSLAGDVVDIAPGLYLEKLTIGPNTTLTLRGTAPSNLYGPPASLASTILSGAKSYRPLSITGPNTIVNIEDLIFTDGDSTNEILAPSQGGSLAIGAGATVVISRVAFTNSAANSLGLYQAGFGGALSLVDSELKIYDSYFANNVANSSSQVGGGLGGALSVYGNSSLVVENSTFFGNKATTTPTFLGITNTSAPDAFGGAISIEILGQDSASVSISNSTFDSNIALSKSIGRGFGGAIQATTGDSAALTVNVTKSTFKYNRAGECILDSNSTPGLPQCVYDVFASPTSNSAITFTPGQGDEMTVAVASTSPTCNHTFTIPLCKYFSGALDFYSYSSKPAILNIADSEIDSNIGGISNVLTYAYSGGVSNENFSATIERTKFDQNIALNAIDVGNQSVGIGGGLSTLSGTTNVVNSFFTRNRAIFASNVTDTSKLFPSADAIDVETVSSLANKTTVLHTTIADNQSNLGTANPSAAIELWGPSAITFLLKASILSGSDYGAGNFASSASASITQSLLYGNGQSIWSGGPFSFNPNEIPSANPQYRDATSGDYHVDKSSPAVNALSGKYTVLDFDSSPRVGKYDIGADEYINGKLSLVATTSQDPSKTGDQFSVAYKVKNLSSKSIGSITLDVDWDVQFDLVGFPASICSVKDFGLVSCQVGAINGGVNTTIDLSFLAIAKGLGNVSGSIKSGEFDSDLTDNKVILSYLIADNSSATPTPTPSATPTSSPTATPTPGISPTPSPSTPPTSSPTLTPTPSVTPSPTPSETQTSTPNPGSDASSNTPVPLPTMQPTVAPTPQITKLSLTKKKFPSKGGVVKITIKTASGHIGDPLTVKLKGKKSGKLLSKNCKLGVSLVPGENKCAIKFKLPALKKLKKAKKKEVFTVSVFFAGVYQMALPLKQPKIVIK